MRVLVTGGAGFIASNLVRRLVRCGHEVLNVDNLTYAGNLASLGAVKDAPNHHFLHADICDAAAMRTAFEEFRPHWVMHLAAESHVDRSIDGPGVFIQTNIIGTYTLLEASLHYWRNLTPSGNVGNLSIIGDSKLPGALSLSDIPPTQESFRFLHVSTDEVYGSLGERDLFTETSAYTPHSPYAASKASSDHLARAWCDTYELPVIVTNCSNNYGPFQFPEKLIPLVILKALRGDPIPVYGTGENIRDWLYVEDHAAALQLVIEKGTPGETYNIGANCEIRNIDLVRLLCSILDEEQPRPDGVSYNSQISFVSDRPGHDFRYAIDSSKIQRELSWHPEQDHQSGFKKTVRWYLDNETWWQNILSGDYRMQRMGIGENEKQVI